MRYPFKVAALLIIACTGCPRSMPTLEIVHSIQIRATCPIPGEHCSITLNTDFGNPLISELAVQQTTQRDAVEPFVEHDITIQLKTEVPIKGFLSNENQPLLSESQSMMVDLVQGSDEFVVAHSWMLQIRPDENDRYVLNIDFYGELPPTI